MTLTNPEPPTAVYSDGPHSLDLDYPTLGRIIAAQARALRDMADSISDDLHRLTGVADERQDAADEEHVPEVPRSLDELIASLNGIGASAYRLARHVRTLVEFRAILESFEAKLEAAG